MKFIKKLIYKIKNKLRNYYRWIVLKDRFLPEVNRWFKEQGDQRLRLDYPLNAESIVFDVGGYEGEWAQQISEKFDSWIFIFEPVQKYAIKIEDKFSENPKIKTLAYGLSEKDCFLDITLNDDNSSFFISNNQGQSQRVALKALTPELLNSLNVDSIDLLKINIEGSEYSLLESIIQNGLIKKITHLQIQFHNFVPNAINQRNKIRNMLTQTHQESWCYEFVWESWEIKA